MADKRASVTGQADIELNAIATVLESEVKRSKSILGDVSGDTRATVTQQKWASSHAGILNGVTKTSAQE
jgi:hypothetical protein